MKDLLKAITNEINVNDRLAIEPYDLLIDKENVERKIVELRQRGLKLERLENDHKKNHYRYKVVRL